MWTLVLATVLYVCTTAAVLVAVPIGALASSAAPLSLVFQTAPSSVQQSFAIIAIVATLNGVLIQMIMASRVLYGLADRGHLPAFLAHVAQRTKTPVVATLSVAVVIAVLALTLPIADLAQRTSQIVLIVFVLVNVALIRIKLAVKTKGPYYEVPMLVPVFGVATSVLLFATSLR